MKKALYIMMLLFLINNILINRQVTFGQMYELYNTSRYAQEDFVLQSPDNKYRVEAVNYVPPGGFYPRSSKVFIKTYNNVINKQINKLKIKGYDKIEQMVFSKNGDYLFLLTSGLATTGEFFMIDFRKLSAGISRNNARRWSVYPYDKKFAVLLDDETKIMILFQSLWNYQVVDFSKYKDELYFSVGDTSMSSELFNY